MLQFQGVFLNSDPHVTLRGQKWLLPMSRRPGFPQEAGRVASPFRRLLRSACTSVPAVSSALVSHRFMDITPPQVRSQPPQKLSSGPRAWTIRSPRWLQSSEDRRSWGSYLPGQTLSDSHMRTEERPASLAVWLAAASRCDAHAASLPTKAILRSGPPEAPRFPTTTLTVPDPGLALALGKTGDVYPAGQGGVWDEGF